MILSRGVHKKELSAISFERVSPGSRRASGAQAAAKSRSHMRTKGWKALQRFPTLRVLSPALGRSRNTAGDSPGQDNTAGSAEDSATTRSGDANDPQRDQPPGSPTDPGRGAAPESPSVLAKNKSTELSNLPVGRLRL